jgi:hypothetical protein
MIRDGYGLEPAEIDVAVEWLRLNPPDEPVALDVAVKMGRHGGKRTNDEQACNASLKYGSRDHWLALSTAVDDRIHSAELPNGRPAVRAALMPV